jgi:hypothetical protein
MSKEVNKEQTKAAQQEEITELSDDQLDEAAGGSPLRGTTEETLTTTESRQELGPENIQKKHLATITYEAF